ncbi:hypothetical protein MKZ38_001045 [Zalerion maritima]|uniref:Calcofluor white hypersensitive protein n=1 Tax=Zalerion maritima TaxID=339359 RepID=A0AAD5RS72_9PEZI|nr:hypothetical protein MKZ38_001045 [Zalerion maritima]
MAARSALPKILGATALGGVGYYFYAAGGSAKSAKNRAEADLHKASADIKAHLPHQEKTDARGIGSKTGAKFDETVAEANKQYGRAESEVKGMAHGARAKIDELDKKIDDEASKAKSSTSGWFGNKK